MIHAEPYGPMMPPLPLIQRAQEGCPEALTALLDPQWAWVYRLAYRMTGHVEDAEDLAQEALVRMVQRLGTFRGDCAFRTWAYRIALNVCLTAKTQRHEPTFDLESAPAADPRPGPETQAVRHLLQAEIGQEIRRLPAAFAQAVLLRHVEDLPYEEIAELLGISVALARIRVHRGMKRLRDRFGSQLQGEAR